MRRAAYGRILAALLAVLAVVGAVGCTGGADESAVDLSQEGLALEMKVFERRRGDCDDPQASCSQIRIEYPVVTCALSDASGAAVNAAILGMLLENTSTGAADPGVERLAEAFFLHYEAAREEFPDAASTARWYIRKKMDVLQLNGRYLSLRLEESAYTGGAHPNSAVSLATFRLPGGEKLSLRDLFPAAALNELERRAERQLRATRGIPEGKSLQEAGFFVRDGELRLGDNFAVTAAGIEVRFNAYEIAPYSMGATTLRFPMDELLPMARDGSVLEGSTGSGGREGS